MPSAEPRQAPPPPAGGAAYHELQRGSAPGTWRPFVGAATLTMAVLAVIPVVVLGVLGLAWQVGGASVEEVTRRFSGDPVTPSYLAATNLVWASAIPTACLVAWLVHRQHPRWLLSVAGRLRWRWFATCVALAALTLVLTVWVSAVLPSQGEGTVEMSGTLNPWTSEVRDYLLIILLLTPLQAAGEEFVFRGYLTQAVGSLGVRLSDRTRATLAVVVPALLFGAAHGIGQDVPVFFDRFAFGLVAGVLVQITGGLEAGIAMHVLNNFVAFGFALAYGDMTATLKVTHGSWWSIPVTLTQSLVYLALCWSVSRRMGVNRRAGEGVLVRR